MCLRKLLVALILSAAASASVPLDALPSEGALQALAASGINSAAEAAALGLDSADLRELGVAEVNDRVAILRQRNEVVAAAASVAAAAATSVGGVVTPEQTRQDFNFVASHVNTTRQVQSQSPSLLRVSHASPRLSTPLHASPCLAIGSHLHVALSPLVRRRS